MDKPASSPRHFRPTGRARIMQFRLHNVHRCIAVPTLPACRAARGSSKNPKRENADIGILIILSLVHCILNEVPLCRDIVREFARADFQHIQCFDTRTAQLTGNFELGIEKSPIQKVNPSHRQTRTVLKLNESVKAKEHNRNLIWCPSRRFRL